MTPAWLPFAVLIGLFVPAIGCVLVELYRRIEHDPHDATHRDPHADRVATGDGR